MERREDAFAQQFAQPQFQQIEPKMDNRGLGEYGPFCANLPREPLAVDAEIPVNEFVGEPAAEGLNASLQEKLGPWL
jgi:hypothetical protein